MPEPAPETSAFRLFRRIVRRWGLRHRRRFLLANALILVVAGATAAYPLLIDWTLDSLQAGVGWILYVVPGLIVGITLAKGVALHLQVMTVSRIVQHMVSDMRSDAYAAMMAQDARTVGRERAGQLHERVLGDTGLLANSLNTLAGRLLRDLVTLLALFGSMVYLDWMLSLTAVLVYFLSVRPVRSIGKRTRALTAVMQQRSGALTAFITESFLGFRLVKAFNLEDERLRRGRDRFEEMRDLDLSLARRQSRLSPILEVGGGLVVALVILIAGWRILEGASTVGAFSGFVSAMLLTLRPARALAAFTVNIQSGAAAAERLFESLDRTPEILDRPGARDLARPRGAIGFHGVHFGYDRDLPVLRGIDLAIAAGESVAFVGPSGAGKTSLVSLVLRLFDPDRGRVTVDGTDIREVTVKSLRASLALVSQEATLFHGTVRENVAYGRLDATEEEVRAALGEAAADFVDRLPEGLDTVVGDQGGRLSGGERQRIAIARAILRDPAVLILDEPTSALDAASEERIRGALRRLAAGRTTVTIAHRLSTIVDADRIFLMDEGRVVDEGTHAYLAHRSPAYRRMVELQKIPDAGGELPRAAAS